MEQSNEKITKAILFAAEAHRRQSRKGSDVPYIFHPVNVGRILAENNCSETVVVAGILHDVLEDTDTKPETLSEHFGERVTDLVSAVTEPNKKDPWKTRKANYIEKAGAATLSTLQIMCADKYDNLRQIERDLQRTGESVWNRFNGTKKQLWWYYATLAGIFLERFERKEDLLLARELEKTVVSVFGAMGRDNPQQR